MYVCVLFLHVCLCTCIYVCVCVCVCVCRAVYIEKCSHCLLVLGAVETAITVNNCDSITIVATCRRLHIRSATSKYGALSHRSLVPRPPPQHSSSSMCTFHILTATRPVILAASLQITFAPYNTHYPALEKHMQQCGLMCGVNYWNQPLCLGTGTVVQPI